MALSQAEWLKKLKELVPSWVFEKEHYNESMFDGLAKILQQGQLKYEDHLKETFIDTAEGEFLDIHADERSVVKFPTDTTSSYRQKIKNILNNANCASLKTLVDALLISGESTFIEHYKTGNFYSREGFYNRNLIDVDIVYNAFTVIVDKQIPEATTFMSRENFYSREDVYGSSESLDNIFENIVSTINDNKALGTVYRLIERGATA